MRIRISFEDEFLADIEAEIDIDDTERAVYAGMRAHCSDKDIYAVNVFSSAELVNTAGDGNSDYIGDNSIVEDLCLVQVYNTGSFKIVGTLKWSGIHFYSGYHTIEKLRELEAQSHQQVV